jgi:hypothetical protein
MPSDKARVADQRVRRHQIMCAAGKAFNPDRPINDASDYAVGRTLLLGFVVQVLLIVSMFVYVENKISKPGLIPTAQSTFIHSDPPIKQ